MILERIIKDEGALQEIQQLTFKLAQMGLYGALYERGAQRSAELYEATNAIEQAALNHAWHQGYTAAVEDVFTFANIFGEPVPSTPPADFNAPETLLHTGEITEDEYKQLRRSTFNPR